MRCDAGVYGRLQCMMQLVRSTECTHAYWPQERGARVVTKVLSYTDAMCTRMNDIL